MTNGKGWVVTTVGSEVTASEGIEPFSPHGT
jgi:hypothetical protein